MRILIREIVVGYMANFGIGKLGKSECHATTLFCWVFVLVFVFNPSVFGFLDLIYFAVPLNFYLRNKEVFGG